MSVGIRGIAQVVVFVEDPLASSLFWAEALNAPQRLADGGALVESPFAEFYFHPVDEEKTPSGEDKNPHGNSTVVYLAVADFDAARNALLSQGCVHWRGPLEIEKERRICQLRDPFGTVWGLDGP